MTKSQLKQTGAVVGNDLYKFGGTVKSGAIVAGKNIGTQAAILKEKIREKQIGTKIMSMFNKKKPAGEGEA